MKLLKMMVKCVAMILLFPSLHTVGETVSLEQGFLYPPHAAKPGVYWYFMDGNMSAEAMTKDLEAMKKAGIEHLVFLEVNIGIPRGPIDFMSEQWLEQFKHAVAESERLGIAITLGVGPGWTGSGGPWVKPEESMQHLVSSAITVTGGSEQTLDLPVPAPKPPFFGEGTLSPEVRALWLNFYEDVAVLAFPTPRENVKIDDIDNKALYYRAPYSSQPGVKQYFSMPCEYEEPDTKAVIAKNEIVDLSDKLQSDGSLTWDVPEGDWTVMRFGRRNNGAITRPAPFPGLGLECDKFDVKALNAHLDQFTEKLFAALEKRDFSQGAGGLKSLHMDSWEMGAQNWTQGFREMFETRRGYDPQSYFPVYAGHIVESLEVSERFLWDLRLTCQELVLENHAGAIKNYAHRHHLGLSIEPYDMNPTADLELACVADMPMCEFWSHGFGFDTAFSAFEGSSAAHLLGQPVVPSEAFTSYLEGWMQYPGAMKDQGDWAFAAGINRMVYHTFQHQSLDDKLRPGVTMGSHGVHWHRNQTWWGMVGAYHAYISRCQFLLQQGRTVADVLFLTPEGAPHVFRAPKSFLDGDEKLPDRKGYNFDACPPSRLFEASVENGNLVFPSGASYKLLVLPNSETMTPELLAKIKELVAAGVTLVGVPPQKSPSLVGYPECDQRVRELVLEIWGDTEPPISFSIRNFGQGKILWSEDMIVNADNLYPNYITVSRAMKLLHVPEDFICHRCTSLRYTHRTGDGFDIYFVANRTENPITAECNFRASDNDQPELWDPLTATQRDLTEFKRFNGEVTRIPMKFGPHQSFFVVFREKSPQTSAYTLKKPNFVEPKTIATLDSPWTVSFDPDWGGPEQATFPTLTDWSKHDDPGIQYYSGTATYDQTFDLPGDVPKEKRVYLDLGNVKNMARVSLNGKMLGVVWTTPWRVDITHALKSKDNRLQIEVVNLWANRLIGDEFLPDDGPQNGQWPDWILNQTERPTKRYTFTTYKFFTKDSPLLESGLLGPVTIQTE